MTGVVRGTVFDSLTMRPLAGATVQFRRQGSSDSVAAYSSRSDERGRYLIDSLPAGQYIAGFFHESLDSLGLDAPLREVRIGRRSTTVNLAIPSARTIAIQLCGPASVSDSTGMLTGFVRNARTLVASVDASIIVQWTRVIVNRQSVAIERPEAEARTRSNGWYALCNVPVGLPIRVAAESGGDSSGMVEVFAQGRGLSRVDLYVGQAEPVLVTAQSAVDSLQLDSTLARGPARLTVRVQNSLGGPIPGARVSVPGSPGSVLTNERGAAVLADLPTGTRMLDVRAVGFVPARERVHLLHVASPNEASVVLTNLETYLDTVRVTARRVFSRDVAGFEQRRRMGFGQFFDQEDIDRKILFRTSDLFQGLLGVTLRQAQLGENLVLMRGTSGGMCRPAVFVDGLRFEVTDIDFVTFPQQLEAVEVYQRASQAPAQFTDTWHGCGSILLWTQQYMGTSRR